MYPGKIYKELLVVEHAPLDVANMKYVLITSVDVECLFSQYNNIFCNQIVAT